ncbi:MAG: YciI family protein [Acidobacteriia bacterium]|nr:YciI family protein [Terriglobia bacterium]
MRFLCVYKPSRAEATPTTQQEMTEMGKLIEEFTKEGVLVSTEGCLPSALGARVRQSAGKVTVTDGPFAEAKELIGGFAMIKANSKQDAIELTKRFLRVAGDGETEIRQLYEAGPIPGKP